MNRHHRDKALLGMALAALVIAGCGDGDGSDSVGASSAATSTGQLNLYITDSPVDDATSVVVQFRSVEVKPANGPPRELPLVPSPRQVDLLAYQNGRAALLLEDVELEAGAYQWMRLIVDNTPNVRDSYVVDRDGRECEMRVPSGSESGLKLEPGFTIPANGEVALTIDFDLRKSLLAPPGQRSRGTDCTQGYLMRPVLRLVNNAEIGALSGRVTFEAGVVPAACLPKVYLFQGSVAPDDLEDSTTASTDVDPLVVTGVDVPEGASSGTYNAAFLPVGTYTAAFTCSDDTTADESLAFTPPAGIVAEVQKNLITTVDFLVPPSS